MGQLGPEPELGSSVEPELGSSVEPELGSSVEPELAGSSAAGGGRDDLASLE